MKLQDAFVSEAGDSYGNWKKIGYVMQDNVNFDYTDPNEGSDATAYLLTTLSATQVWKAENKANLNECTAPSVWEIKADKTSDALGPITYAATAPSDCLLLNPSFERIGK